jgi:predicted dehydrogenase
MIDLRVGIIGSGFMGRTHAEAFARYVRGVRLVAVTGGSRAGEIARDYHIEAEQTVGSLLERTDIDAIVISTCSLRSQWRSLLKHAAP